MDMLYVTCLIVLVIPMGVLIALDILLPVVSPIHKDANNPHDGSANVENNRNSTKSQANLHNT